MLVVGKLLISSHFLQAFSSMRLASKDLFGLFNCVKLSIISTSNFKDFAETTLTKFPYRLEALLEVRLIFVLVVKATGQRIE